jgi:hypothetical protein
MMIMHGFWGVVEDRNDPSQLGRVRVRIIGLHTDDKSESGISTDTLMWAYPLMPITSANVNGVGQSPLGVLEGSWVFGFFRDGEAAQDPVVMGSIGGIPRGLPNTDMGFSDPSGVYPKVDFINEPDMNRLSRGVTTDENDETVGEDWIDPVDQTPHANKIGNTIVKTKQYAREQDKEVSIGKGRDGTNSTGDHSETWTEPHIPYTAKYPFNHVRESESGHIEEWDDTPGATRLHKYHNSGTFEETHDDGTKVTKVVGDQYTIVYGEDFIHVKGDVSITVDGDANIYTKGTVNEQVDGDYHRHITGNFIEQVDGKVDRKIGGTFDQVSGGNAKVIAPRIDLNP